MVNYVLDGLTIDASLIVAPQIAGQAYTIDSSASATVDVCANAFDQVFYFYTDANPGDPPDDTKDMQFAVWHENWPDISFSEAKVTIDSGVNGGDTGAAPNKTNADLDKIPIDLIRWWAYDLFGTGLAVDIFNNETAMINDVINHDVSFGTIIRGPEFLQHVSAGTVLANESRGYRRPAEDNNKKNFSYRLFQQLLDTSYGVARLTTTDLLKETDASLNAANNNYDEVTISGDEFTTTNSPGKLTDVSFNMYNLTFAAGDTLALKLTYNPHSTAPPSWTSLQVSQKSHNYKIVLNMT